MRNPHRPGLGGTPGKDGLSKRFENFIAAHSEKPGVPFLGEAFKYVCDTLKMDGDAFLLEMVDAILGDHYPTPDRMLTLTERIVHKYLEQEMLAEDTSIGKFDLFATEGGTAAMDYIFTSLLENKILHKGDKIALGTPIFTLDAPASSHGAVLPSLPHGQKGNLQKHDPRHRDPTVQDPLWGSGHSAS